MIIRPRQMDRQRRCAFAARSASQPTRRTSPTSVLTALLVALPLGSASTAAVATVVHLNTAALAGTAATLDFSLLDGDGLFGNNSVLISTLVADVPLGTTDCVVGCSGGPPFVLNESSGLGQFLQHLTLGTTLSFALTFSTNLHAAGAADRFSLAILDPTTNFTLVDTDLDFANDVVPVQDALLLVDLQPGTTLRPANTTTPALPVSVPEPGVAGLLALALSLCGVARIRRASSRVSTVAPAAAGTGRPLSLPTNLGEER